MASVTKHMIPQILLFVICIVIYYHTTKIGQEKQQRPTETETETVVPAVKSGTMATTTNPMSERHGGDAEEIFGVKIERNPSQSKLDQLGVTSWPTWAGSPSQIPWTFTAKETMYLLEGKVKVYCDGHDKFFEIGAGDLVEFPKGMKITWHVIEAVKKHYNLDK